MCFGTFNFDIVGIDFIRHFPIFEGNDVNTRLVFPVPVEPTFFQDRHPNSLLSSR
jgi:hypothetical protein